MDAFIAAQLWKQGEIITKHCDDDPITRDWCSQSFQTFNQINHTVFVDSF